MEENTAHEANIAGTHIHRRFEIYLVVSTHGGGKVITDQGNFILCHHEWLSIREEIDKFYREATDEEIKEANERDREREIAKWEEYDLALAAKSRKNKQETAGHIYMVRAIGTNLYKIGITSNSVSGRIKGIQTSSPHKLELVCSVFAKNHEQREAELHTLLADKRTSGEWFCLSAPEAMWIMGEIDRCGEYEWEVGEDEH